MLSRLNRSDLYKIVLQHDRIYAVDAPIGALIVSRDGGRTCDEQFTPTGVLIADFEVAPDDPRRIVAAGDADVFGSADDGTSWQTVGRIDGEPHRMKAVSSEELYVVIGDGTILHTRDGGTSWEEAFSP